MRCVRPKFDQTVDIVSLCLAIYCSLFCGAVDILFTGGEYILSCSGADCDIVHRTSVSELTKCK